MLGVGLLTRLLAADPRGVAGADARDEVVAPAAWAPILVVAALAYGAATQGAYHAEQYVVLLALCVASVAAGWRTTVLGARDRLVPWAAAAVLAAGALAVGVLHGSLVEVLPAISIAGVVLAGLLAASDGERAGRVLRAGLVVVGVGVATTVWVGVATHHEPWGKVIAGLWRGAGSITYVNATAALLSMALLVALAATVADPSQRVRLATWALAVGLLLTLSRAGIAAALLGAVVLAVLLGARRVGAEVAHLTPATVVAVAATVPTMAEARPPQLLVAGVGLLAGAALAVTRRSPRTSLLLAVALVLVGSLALSTAAAGRIVLDRVGATRVGLESVDRGHEWRLALDRAAGEPLAGHAPVGAPYQWQGQDGRWYVAPYAHNEYLDLLAGYGLVGATALAAAVALVARGWRRAAPPRGRRPVPYRAGAAAALTAFAVHSAFDFLWHVPVLVLAAAVLAGSGLAVPEPPLDPKEPS